MIPSVGDDFMNSITWIFNRDRKKHKHKWTDKHNWRKGFVKTCWLCGITKAVKHG